MLHDFFYFIFYQDAAEEVQEKKEKKKKKKKKKDKKQKKEMEDEEKINNMDQQNNAKPESEADKNIPAPAWDESSKPTVHFSPRNTSNGAGLLSQFLHRSSSQNNVSDESGDSEDNGPARGPESYNILSTPRRRRSKFQASDSDSDAPRRIRKKKSLRRVESSTEDERRTKSSFFKRHRSRQLSDTD